MNAIELKYNLFKTIDTINDNSTLNKVMAFISSLKKEKVDGWDALTKVQQREIEEAVRSLDRGEGIPHEKVMAKYRKKYF